MHTCGGIVLLKIEIKSTQKTRWGGGGGQYQSTGVSERGSIGEGEYRGGGVVLNTVQQYKENDRVIIIAQLCIA